MSAHLLRTDRPPDVTDGARSPRTDAIRGENFPVALGILPSALRRHLVAVYGYARYVDDLGDQAPGDREPRLRAVAADVRRLYDGRAPRDPQVAALQSTVVTCRLPMDCLLRLVEANLVDQRVLRYASFESLLGYCRLSANPVGEIVLHVLGRATPDRIALSDRICTGLQLLEHWQDVGEDYRAGRVYLPQDDLRRFRVAEDELAGRRAGEQLRALLAFETDRALAWIDAGAPLVSTLGGWGRLAVSGYVAGGRAAARELRRCGHDPLARTPKPSGRQVGAAWLEALVRWPG